MDWDLAIERNRTALKRIVAGLVAMAELDATAAKLTLPRHLHRAILRLLRPAESAVRRLVIVMARGLVVTLAPPRPRRPKPAPTILRNGVGTGIILPPGAVLSGLRGRSSDRAGGSIVGREGRGDCEAIGVPGKIGEASGTTARTLALPLFDPLRRPFRSRRPSANGVPRISLPGVTALSPIAPRLPPAPDDPLNATRLALRLQALGAALDDLPGQARRFARWKAARAAGRDAAGAQNKNPDAAGAQDNKHAGRARRAWPLRPGRPPGQRPANKRAEVHDILHDLHGLAFDLLEQPDTS
jgi:hypothetical protein